MKVLRGASLWMGALAAIFCSANAVAADISQSTEFTATEYSGSGVVDFTLAPDLPEGFAIVPSVFHPGGQSVTLPVDGTMIIGEYGIIGGDLSSMGPALTLFFRDLDVELDHLKFGFTPEGAGAVLYGSEFGPRYGRPVFTLGDVTTTIDGDSVTLEAPVMLNVFMAKGLNIDDYANTMIGSIRVEADNLAVREADMSAINDDDRGAVASGCPGGGPCGNSADVFTLEVGSAFNEYGATGGIGAYAISTTSCNQGDEWAIWLSGQNQHPLIAQNLFRIKDGAFEHIGMSWLKHAWCAADFFACAGGGSPNGTCNYMTIGIADVYSAGLNADQGDLGPRSDINAASGEYPYPYTIAWNQGGNNIFKRLQVANSDLADSTGTDGNAIYLGEAYYVTSDEAPNDFDTQYNNASWRRVTRSGFNGSQYPLAFTGSNMVQETALEGWQDFDSDITIENVFVPDEKFENGSSAPDGRLVVGTNVTDLGGGMWQYNWTVYNFNSDRGIRSFSIELPDDATGTVGSFHAPNYHSGDRQQGAGGWSFLASSNATWTGDTYTGSAQTGGNELSGNAIRWSTANSFQLVTSAPPDRATASLGVFKPGTPSSVFANTTGPAPDCNGNNQADSIDIAEGEPDTNDNGVPDVCESEILVINSIVPLAYDSMEIQIVGNSETPFAIRVDGDAKNSEISCVSAYLQEDGSLGAAPVLHTLTEWTGFGTTATGPEIVPGGTYTISTEGFVVDPQVITIPAWGDVNLNGAVNLEDALVAAIAFNQTNYISWADVDGCGGNGVINLADIQLVVGSWQLTFTYAGTCGVPCKP